MSKRRTSKPFESTIRPPPPPEDEEDQIEVATSLDALFQPEPSRVLKKLLTPPPDHPLEEVKVRRRRKSSSSG